MVAMFAAISKEAKRKLWKHQAYALDFAIDHLNGLDSPSLIRMPTGTGKTGVIACLSRMSNPRSTLVLTPWAHLRSQMVADLANGFWKKVDLTPSAVKVESISPSTADKALQSNEPRVLVATFATLNDLRLNYPSTYASLADFVSLVIVDEGHYEPAVEWGKSVKGLKAKTVLLTATPYRNDLKLFRITDSRRSTHHFTHKQAVEDNIIRELRFESLPSKLDIPSLSRAFIKKWRDAKRDKTLPSSSPRAIICCARADEIESAVTEIRKASLDAIGVHEQFEDSASKYLLKDVPDPQSSDAEIWIHQNKLTEGLDDHRFCCVTLFSRVPNDRKLIQQIGRILRRHKGERNTPAIFLAPPEFSAETEWQAYLEFETQLKLLDPQHFRDVVDTLLGAQPPVEYFDGRFRRRFAPNHLSSQPQVLIPPSVLVRSVGAGFSLEDYVEDCTDTLNTEDAVILGPQSNAPCHRDTTFALWVYASVRNSRFLHDTSLYEIKLETHCVVVTGGFVFITDSSGNFPVEFLEEHTTAVSNDKLTRYLDKTFRPTHVSVDSSIPYDTVLRGAEVRGHNLLNIPASLTDRVQICRSARGTSTKKGRRYVGINRGRLRQEVSEGSRRTYELKTFVGWAQDLAKILNSQVASSDLFRRYMPTCAPPANPVPKTISLDLLDSTMTLADGTECFLMGSSSDVQATSMGFECTFHFDVDGATGPPITLQIEYHPTKKRFWFKKGKGASVRVHPDQADASATKSLAEFLNQNQEIIFIGLQGGEIVYQARNFYKIDYSYAEEVLLDLIIQPPNAPACATEKGTKEQIAEAKRLRAANFPQHSLFRAIAGRRIELPFDDELLVCDDLGTECADFVAANFDDHQLALIHAKAGGGATISASAFHDVVSQAMKNLVYLSKNQEVPKGITSWRRDGKWNNTGTPRLWRIPSGVPSGQRLWEKLKTDIIDTSNPGLYVLLITTGCCNLQELTEAVRDRTKRTPEVAQLLHLLDGLNGYARQIGARLIVYDVPHRSP
jgi:hypothetical protein